MNMCENNDFDFNDDNSEDLLVERDKNDKF